MEEKKEKRGGPLVLDWDVLLPSAGSGHVEDDEPPPEIVVAVTVDDDDVAAAERLPPPADAAEREVQPQASAREEYERMTDHVLETTLRRRLQSVNNLGPKLPDKGARLRANIKLLQEEQERRKRRKSQPDASTCQMLTETSTAIDEDICLTGASNGFKQEAQSSQSHRPSVFASIFSNKLDKNMDAFKKELTLMGRCNRQKTRQNEESSQKQRHKRLSDINKRAPSSSQKDRASPFNYSGKTLPSFFTIKRNASETLPSNGSRPHKLQTVLLVDEEEPQCMEMEQADELYERIKETTIYYPSRDDADSVEICYADIACLDPEAYLSSTIMNFYIRYLQQLASPTDRTPPNYHFFNTYFYLKLKEAVSNRNDKESFFKFRRWWKGVNIFQKAYILIPIHEDLHWSLVIICIPDKEDESGPIILHLDSLKLHNSKSIFSNIKSFLREEWNYLNQELAPPDAPIADDVWKQLPERMNEKILAVPQQRNEYDCGLFVLYFMERFIHEAPERLKKIDLAMFGRQWFRPQDASSLRGEIRKLLIQEFKSAINEQS